MEETKAMDRWTNLGEDIRQNVPSKLRRQPIVVVSVLFVSLPVVSRQDYLHETNRRSQQEDVDHTHTDGAIGPWMPKR